MLKLDNTDRWCLSTTLGRMGNSFIYTHSCSSLKGGKDGFGSSWFPGDLREERRQISIILQGIRKTKEGYFLIMMLFPFHQKIDLGLGIGEMELI